MRRLPIVLLLALLGGSAAAEGPLVVSLNHSVRLPINQKVQSIVVSDPSIADVMVVDGHTVFVRGKAYGRTDITALGEESRPAWHGEVTVVAAGAGQVTVMRGLKPTDYSCAGSQECSASTPAQSQSGQQTPSMPSRPVSGVPPR